MNTVIQAVLERRSCRAYKAQQFSEEELQQILLAGTYAASGMGRQSGKIVVVQDKDTIEQLRAMNAAVDLGGEDPKAVAAEFLRKKGLIPDEQ